MSPKAGELNEADGGPKGARTVLFGEALASAMAAAGVSQNELAAQMNVKQPTVSAWCNADAEPRYEVVFAIERALGAKPGQLSRILGYLPMEAVRITGGVEESIRDDPRLSDDARSTLLSTYRFIVGSKGSRRGRPRS
jgi:transcriptional regulator with XRE-family HTH domain